MIDDQCPQKSPCTASFGCEDGALCISITLLHFAGAILADILSRQAVGGGGEEGGSLQQAALPELRLALTGEPWRMAGVLLEALLSAEVAVCFLCHCLPGLRCSLGMKHAQCPRYVCVRVCVDGNMVGDVSPPACLTLSSG